MTGWRTTFRVTAGIPSNADPLGRMGGPRLASCAGTSRRPLPVRVRPVSTPARATSPSRPRPRPGRDAGRMPGARMDTWGVSRQTSTTGCASTSKCGRPSTRITRSWPGMIDMYQHSGNKQALDIAEAWPTGPILTCALLRRRMAEHADGGIRRHAGVLFNLYAITGKKEYARPCVRFSHHKIFDPLAESEDDLRWQSCEYATSLR